MKIPAGIVKNNDIEILENIVNEDYINDEDNKSIIDNKKNLIFLHLLVKKNMKIGMN